MGEHIGGAPWVSPMVEHHGSTMGEHHGSTMGKYHRQALWGSTMGDHHGRAPWGKSLFLFLTLGKLSHRGAVGGAMEKNEWHNKKPKD